MKIAIMGSGAVGAYVGARLQAAGADVTFIARGENAALPTLTPVAAPALGSHCTMDKSRSGMVMEKGLAVMMVRAGFAPLGSTTDSDTVRESMGRLGSMS